MLQLLQIQSRLQITPNIDLRGYFRDINLIQIDLINDDNISAEVQHFSAVGVPLVLLLKLKDPPRFPLAFQNLALAYVVV